MIINFIKNRSAKVLASLVLYTLPLVVLAQSNAQTLIDRIGGLIDALIPIAASLALLFFFWGIVKYIWNSGNESEQEEGRKIIARGIIALFVIAAIFGIIELLSTIIGVGTGGTLDPPVVDPNLLTE